MFVNEPINPVLSRTVTITIYLDNISPPFLIRMQGYQWSQSKEGMVGTLCIQVTVSLLTFSSGGGNGIRSVVSHHQPDFFHACLRILHAIAPEKNCEILLRRVWREALMAVAPWPCAHKGMAQVIFQGLDSVSTKPTIELSREHLQS